MNHTTSEVLDLAADDIQANGWAQGPQGMAVDGPHCILGAIGSVMEVTAYRTNLPLATDMNHVGFAYDMHEVGKTEAGMAMIDYLPEPDWSTEGLPGYSLVYRWNDRGTRTAEDVIAALRAAAAVERVKESAEQTVAA